MSKKDAMRAAVEALQTALPYVEADLNERMRIYGPNREHRWRAEMDDRQQIDTALSLLRAALEEGEEPHTSLPPMDVGIQGQIKFAYSEEALRAYVEAVREECALLCEDRAGPYDDDEGIALREVAATIRSKD